MVPFQEIMGQNRHPCWKSCSHLLNSLCAWRHLNLILLQVYAQGKMIMKKKMCTSYKFVMTLSQFLSMSRCDNLFSNFRVWPRVLFSLHKYSRPRSCMKSDIIKTQLALVVAPSCTRRTLHTGFLLTLKNGQEFFFLNWYWSDSDLLIFHVFLMIMSYHPIYLTKHWPFMRVCDGYAGMQMCLGNIWLCY